MNDPQELPPEPANLRFLRRLVTGLTAVMLGGLILVIALLVTRLRDDTPPLPETLTLPEGVTARAVTLAEGVTLVVTSDNRLLIYDRLSGKLKQSVTLD